MSKGEWIEYSWEFVAEDTFTHLTIGNFWKREQQNMIKWLFNFPCSIIRDSCIAYSDWEMYAFIDSVYLIALDSFSLTKDTAVCIGENIELREAFGREITWILENGSEVVSDVLHLEITKAVEQIVGLWNGEYDTLYVFGKETPAYSIQHTDSLCKYTRNDFNRLQIHIEEQGVSAFWQINGTDQTGKEFASADTGYVYLTLTDSLGCIVRDTFYLEEYCPEFSDICGFPNAFSPNGDGLNDVLSINCVNISSAQISVLNRWGEILSISENLGSAWDGTFDGKPCQAGVYTIIIQYYIFTQPDKKYIYIGTLNLLR
jgi:gliding motility-associated-like protein